MTERNEIKQQTFTLSIPDFFMLKTTDRLKGYDKFKHEKGGGDLFVSMYPFMNAWSFEPPIGGERGDRGMKFGEKTVYFEIDRCTEGLKVIDRKLESYIKYASQSGERFYVVFSIMGTEREVENRGNNLIPILQSKRHGHQFLIANHSNLLNNPLGDNLYSPLNEILSLGALE